MRSLRFLWISPVRTDNSVSSASFSFKCCSISAMESIRLFDLRCLLGAFVFSLNDIAPRAFDQLRQFLRALTVEFDAVAVRGNLAVQSLNFRTAVGYLAVDLVQFGAFFGERVF
jgi:hypothetical protein